MCGVRHSRYLDSFCKGFYFLTSDINGLLSLLALAFRRWLVDGPWELLLCVCVWGPVEGVGVFYLLWNFNCYLQYCYGSKMLERESVS